MIPSPPFSSHPRRAREDARRRAGAREIIRLLAAIGFEVHRATSTGSGRRTDQATRSAPSPVRCRRHRRGGGVDSTATPRCPAGSPPGPRREGSRACRPPPCPPRGACRASVRSRPGRARWSPVRRGARRRRTPSGARVTNPDHRRGAVPAGKPAPGPARRPAAQCGAAARVTSRCSRSASVFSTQWCAETPRLERGGAGGADLVKLPGEDERVSLLLARPGDDARTAVAAVAGDRGRALRLAHVRLDADREAPCPTASTRRGARSSWTRRRARARHRGRGRPGRRSRARGPRARPRAPDRTGSTAPLRCSPTRRGDRRRTRCGRPARFPSRTSTLRSWSTRRSHVHAVKASLRDAAGELCESVACFDAYRGPGVPAGSRSLALRVRLGAADRTLSEAELTATRAAMIDAASDSAGGDTSLSGAAGDVWRARSPR